MERLTLVVSVREVSGQPLGVQAIVRVSPELNGGTLMQMTHEGAIASFPNMSGGGYEVEVQAAGYKTAHEQAELVGGTSSTVYVYMTPDGAPDATSSVDQRSVVTPKLQRGLERALEAILEKKYDEGRKHLILASKMAPANPEIEYLLGIVDYAEKNLEPAAVHFEKTLNLAPNHEKALLSLARLQLDTREYQKSASNLETAIQNNTKNSQAHMLLAVCYIKLESFSKARVEALASGDLDKSKGAPMHLLAAKTYVMENNLPAASDALKAFIREFPNDKGVAEANQILENIAKAGSTNTPAANVVASTIEMAAAQPPASLTIKQPWAPADIDERLPAVAPDVVCSTEDVVKRVRNRSELALGDLERFGATEKIEHQEIDALGNPGQVKSRDFSYMILIHHSNPDYHFVEERRDGEDSLTSFPSSLATRGLVSIGPNVFHPLFANDMNFSCEGLGRWSGHPAWQIHFSQKQEVPSKIRSWLYHGKIYPVPMKGRAWISPNTYDIIHLETDLREPLKDLQLTREHLSIDYGPTKFRQVKEQVWLPQSAEMYFSFLGKRYHHKHTLSDYVLFSVDEKSKISAPAQAPAGSETTQP